MPESGIDVFDRYPEHLRALAQTLCGVVAADRSGRKAPRFCRVGTLLEAALTLERAASVVIVTGFLVPEAKAAETDGPPGSAVLGRALLRLGKECGIITDPFCLGGVEAASRAIGGPRVEAVSSPSDVLQARPDCLVFVERLGGAKDGRYYNMRGEDISEWTLPLDRASDLARREGVPVIALGDGGNEAGMGCLNGSLGELLPDFLACLCAVEADFCLPVDVSNWGCYALSALLSAIRGEWVGHFPEEESAMLASMALSGAVDGITKKRERTVDGFSEEENLRVVEAIRKSFEKAPPIPRFFP
ncbi:MAG: DUF4392 domain-containing protein [Synergistaceae bacterium]|nr:DUF4392 domain-containing protein [Synergistaceae bacterium]